MYGLMRGVATLIGVAAAGFLIWLASTFAWEETGGFWIAMGLLAGAGCSLAISQVVSGWTRGVSGRGGFSSGTFLVGFLPTALAVAWVLLAVQPEGGWQQLRLEGWSGSIGILGFVNGLGEFAPVLAFLGGAVLAFCFDNVGRRERIVEERPVVVEEDVHDYRDRDVVREREVVETVPATERTEVVSGERVEIHEPGRRPS